MHQDLQSEEVTQKDRYRVVLMALHGQNLRTIMGAVGRTRDFVERWVCACRDGGLSALSRRSETDRLEQNDEEAMAAQPAETAAAYRVRAIEGLQILEECYGVEFPGVEHLLCRPTPVTPSPRAVHLGNGPRTGQSPEQKTPPLSKRRRPRHTKG